MWKENSIYPGTHWLYYNSRGDYIARIDRQPYYGSGYRWVCFMFSDSKRVVGYVETLKDAKKAVQAIIENQPVQLPLSGIL